MRRPARVLILCSPFCLCPFPTEIRRAAERLRPNHILANGWTAGEFSLCFVQGIYSRRQASKAAREARLAKSRGCDGSGPVEDEDEDEMSESDL